ncbi:Transmembrane protein 181 [Camelus dromedarius]|uniref:Transmembrane protein 181 n=1 Tax=Camelus dromedarius TaxID=9838 RepID=A0A5N4DXA6_CAMDR|nr:Transmembrane protein 181 [Camelus dromedarius]
MGRPWPCPPTAHPVSPHRLAPMRLYTLSKRHFVLVFVVFFVCFGLTVFVGIRETSLQTNFLMTVKVDGVAQDGTTIHNKVHNRTRTLTCAEKCAEIIVVHLGYLNYTQYTVIVGFEHLSPPIKEMNFTWKTYDPAFSKLEIWFRFVFVVLTFIVTCLFAHSLRKFSMRDWGIEQKWMSILLPLLLLYNDPFFPLSFLVNSWFPGMLDDLFQSVFLCALLLFWLCVYHGIRVQGMKVFFMVVAAVYVLYLLFLIVRACSELRHMPYVDLRLKFLTALTFVVLVISIVILYLRGLALWHPDVRVWTLGPGGRFTVTDVRSSGRLA